MSPSTSPLSFPSSSSILPAIVPNGSPPSSTANPSASSRHGELASTQTDNPNPQTSRRLTSNGVDATLPQSSLSRRPNPPRRLLRTHEGVYTTSQDTSYFATRPGSPLHRFQTTPVSDHLSKPAPGGLSSGRSSGGSLSPGRSSGGSPYNPWESGISSIISGGHLSPPPPRHPDSPPYKPRSPRSGSLTMIPKLMRSKSLPPLGSPSTTREGEKEYRYGHKRNKFRKNKSSLNTGLLNSEGQFIDPSRLETWRNQLQRARITSPSQRGSAVAPSTPLQSRRWSSVGVEGTLRPDLGDISDVFNKFPSRTGINPRKEKARPLPNTEVKLNDPLVDDDVGIVRQIMTVKRVDAGQVTPPKSITLERASSIEREGIPSFISGTRCLQLLAHQYDEESCKAYCPRDLYQRRTSNDGLPPAKTVFESHSSSSTKSPRFSRKARGQGESAQTGEAGERSGHSSVTPRQIVYDIFCKPEESPNGKPESREVNKVAQVGCLEEAFPRSQSQNGHPAPQLSSQGMYEVIWKQDISPLGSPLESCKMPESTYYESEPVSPLLITRILTTSQEASTFGSLVSSCFPSSKDWSLNPTSTPAVPAKAPSKRKSTVSLNAATNGGIRNTRESNRAGSARKSITMKPHRRPHRTLSEPRLQDLVDVVSFPPLPPRQSTTDWHSPLPDIETALKKNPKSLYHMGLRTIGKITQGPFKPMPIPNMFSLSGGGNKRRFRSGTMPSLHIKNTINVQPKATPLVAVSAEVSHALEKCSGDRRRSSTTVMKRVTTIDNERKALKTGTWTPARPPSVCPPPQQPLLSSELKIRIPSISEGMRQSETCSPGTKDLAKDRLVIIQQKTPQTPIIDRAGIYGRFTGTGLDKSDSISICSEHCPPGECTYCDVDSRSPSVDWIA